jgi:uncharacterized protein YkwD
MRIGTRFTLVRSLVVRSLFVRSLLVRSLVVPIAGVTLLAAAFAQNAASAERDLFTAVNQARRSQGLPALRWDDALAVAARRHAGLMAQHGSAQHAFAGESSLSARVKEAGAHFGWLAENVTQGPTVDFIQSQFLSSPNHRANMLDREMDSIGVGVVERGGQLFAVEDFSQAR